MQDALDNEYWKGNEKKLSDEIIAKLNGDKNLLLRKLDIMKKEIYHIKTGLVLWTIAGFSTGFASASILWRFINV